MGIIILNGWEFTIRPYKTTRTYRVLRRRGCGVVNIVHDPMLFFRSAFKEFEPGGNLPNELFDRARRVEAPRLRGADAHVEFNVDRESDESPERGVFLCRMVSSEAATQKLAPYSRAVHAAMESIIHATKVRALRRTANRAEADRLIAMISHHRNIIEKIWPNSEYLAVADKLLAQAEKWQKESTGRSAR